MSQPQEIPSFDLSRCAAYLDGTRDAPPREQLMRAITLCKGSAGRRALDIGCGPGKEVAELLRAGFRVTAIDPYPSMIELTQTLVREREPAAAARLQLSQARLEDFAAQLPASAFDLVHAGFVLPFIATADFERTFAALLASVAPSGVFAGQFFGPDDEFVKTSPQGSMTSHAAAEIPRILGGFQLVEHEEVNRSGFIGRGRAKWWHVHHVIARKTG
jgi:SAM-dependent methyltransferase